MKENKSFLPCPFCGAEAKCMNYGQQFDRLGSFDWYVECVKCHISTPLSDWHTVRELWNRRVEGKKMKMREICDGKMFDPHGRTESLMSVLGDALKTAYKRGYFDGVSDRVESEYDRGYEAAKADLDLIPCQQADKTSDKAYKDGMDTAWEAARKICSGQFAGKLDTGMILNITESDAIETIKLNEYEAAEVDREGSSIVPMENMFNFIESLKRKGIHHCTVTINEGKALIEWGKEDGEASQ